MHLCSRMESLQKLEKSCAYQPRKLLGACPTLQMLKLSMFVQQLLFRRHLHNVSWWTVGKTDGAEVTFLVIRISRDPTNDTDLVLRCFYLEDLNGHQQ